MAKKIHLKKPKKKKFKYLIYILIIYLLYQIVLNYFNNLNLATNNEDFIRALLANSNYHLRYEKNSNNLINILTNLITNFDLNKPSTVLEKSFKLKDYNDEKMIKNDSDNDLSLEELEKISNYIKDPYDTEINNPRIYIYNTHQHENYSNKNLEIYNITPNVMMASYLLKEKLNQLGVPTVVEEANLIEFMRLNNWEHKDSYKASRFYIIDAMNKYKNLDLLIDLHRDSLSKEASTTEIDGKNYAKILFVVGLDNPSYQENLNLANKIHELVSNKYPTLSRGVLTKKGPLNDGVYNQDLSSKMILLEVGAQYNTIDEVLNTIEVLSHIFKEIIGDA